MPQHTLTVDAMIGSFIADLSPQTPIDWIRIIRRGLPVQAIESIIRATRMTQSELARCVGLAERTLMRRKKACATHPDTRLTPEESSRVLRLVRTLAVAGQVFNDFDLAMAWLRQPHSVMQDQRPLDLLDTDLGTELVVSSLTGMVAH